MVDAVLIFPPAYYPWFIPPGLSYLTAYLRHHGFSVVQRDANLGAIEYVLSPTNLARLDAPAHLVKGIAGALATMRNESAYHAFWPYYEAKRLIEEASELVNNHTRDTFRIFRNTLQYISFYDARQREEILKAIKGRDHHLFFEYFLNVEVPALKELRPRLIGLSINDHHQLIPSFVFAGLVREYLPDSHICMGGNLIARIQATLEKADLVNLQLFRYVNSFVHHEGEQPLRALLESLTGRAPANRPIPHLIWHDGDVVRGGPRSEPLALGSLPLPAAEAYHPWTPKPVVALNIYRGCYYTGICTFCDINDGYDSVTHEPDATGRVRVRLKKRLRPMAIVAQDLMELHRRYGTTVFSFTDEWFRVQEILELGSHLKAAEVEFHWEAYTRFEKAFLRPEVCQAVREAGCRFLQFGLESISPTTLKAMRKGNTPVEYATILANTTAADIWNHVFFIVGYPEEPIHHVLPLFAFLCRHAKGVLTIKPTRFQLARRAPLLHTPPSFIESLTEDKWDFYINIPFQYRGLWRCPLCRSEVEPADARSKRRRLKCPRCGSYLEQWTPTSHKGIDAIYTLAEVLCETHWAHPVTSLFPYVSRLFLTKGEIEHFTTFAPRHPVVPTENIIDALVKVRRALARESEMVPDIGRVYESTGLMLPPTFESFTAFLDFCGAWEEAAGRADL